MADYGYLQHVMEENDRLRAQAARDENALSWLLDYVIEPQDGVVGNAGGIKRYVLEIRAGKRDKDGRRIWTAEENALVEEMSKRATPVDVSRFEPLIASGEFGEVK